MREITTHKINPANDTITIKVTDEPGAGGANHCYEITGFNETSNASGANGLCWTRIVFQNGPIQQLGVNGITQEVLLAIIQDRLESFQAGLWACEENGKALEAVRQAQHWLQFRTLKRMARGVEGTHQK